MKDGKYRELRVGDKFIQRATDDGRCLRQASLLMKTENGPIVVGNGGRYPIIQDDTDIILILL